MKKTLLKCLCLLCIGLCGIAPIGCNHNNDSSSSPTEGNWYDKYSCISLSEAINIATAAGEQETSEKYYVYGTIATISNPTYGEMTITDGTDSLFIYGTYSADGVKRYSELDDKPVKGDAIVLYGSLNFFKEKAQMRAGWIQEFKHEAPPIDPSDYTEKTIAAAREDQAEAKVQVTGVVAKITYANGMKPNGFYLVDNTGSIYVYGEEAAQLQEGNRVTIAGEKTYFVQEKEIEFAKKFGYAGCCQIQSPYILSNDNGKNDFDKSWIQESTVKAIMDTPVTENITTSIYKVNALVKKQQGDGFVNYYFNDLDEKTGSYTYTMCNGSDFQYLDAFDGKICTVYLSPINAKSTATGCNFRFLPIAVIDENFTFNFDDAAQFAVDYYGVDQFEAVYQADPNLQLITSVSSTLLGFSNATLSYSSSDTEVVYFETVDENVFMHTKNVGTAEITIEGKYLDKQPATAVVNIAVESANDIEAVTVKEAIDAADETEVTVKGVVASSLVNKNGFYLIDETGVIAVVVNDVEILKSIKLGNLVVMKGIRSHSQPTDTVVGNSYINNATLEMNFYGEHAYSKATFDSTKTIEEIYALEVSKDYSTQVYVLDAKIKVESTGYSSNIYLTNEDGTVKLSLYCSSAKQYSFLEPYDGQTITLEIAPCNWNKKNFYKYCVLSYTVDNVTYLNDLNFRN